MLVKPRWIYSCIEPIAAVRVLPASIGVTSTVFLKARIMVRTKATFVVFVSVPILLTISCVLSLWLLRLTVGLLLFLCRLLFTLLLLVPGLLLFLLLWLGRLLLFRLGLLLFFRFSLLPLLCSFWLLFLFLWLGLVLLCRLSLFFLFCWLSRFLVMLFLRERRNSRSEKQEQGRCADDFKCFHDCCLHYQNSV